ncbi:MAG: ferritin-like domain-containing protein [Elainellaceae cyanobacterium]
MNLFTSVLSLVGSGASAYIMARNMRDIQTRPNMLAGLQMAESGSVPLLEALGKRAADEGDDWLAERLQIHANDERRHGQIFASGLRNLNKQVLDPETLRQRREAEAKATASDPDQKKSRSPFFDAYFRGYTAEDLKAENFEWQVFFPSTYTLELDACKDFERMARALPDDPQSRQLQQGILSVARDEERHAAYLFEAMTRRYSYAQVMDMVDEWRSRKVDALLAMVGQFIQRDGQAHSLVQDGVPEETAANGAEEPSGSEKVSSFGESEAIAA